MSSPEHAVLTGDRVVVRRVRADDERLYRTAVLGSRERIGQWNPVDPDGFPAILAAQGSRLSWLVLDRDTGDLAAWVNLNDVVRGRACSAALGYDAYDPWAGTGRTLEGLRLVIDHALRPQDHGGLGLHRVEAVVQPGNVRSAGLLRRLGFRPEGRSRRFLRVPRPGEGDGWRDLDRYAVTAEEWPAQDYAPVRPDRLAVLVNGLPGSGKTTLARALARELGLALLAKDVVKEAMADVLPAEVLDQLPTPRSPLGAAVMAGLWALLAQAPHGAVVESWWRADDAAYADAGLRRAGFDPAGAVEVWCDVPWRVARDRYEARAAGRHAVHGPQVGLAWWETEGPTAAPLGLGPVVRADTTAPLDDRAAAHVALAVKAAADGAHRSAPGARPRP